MKKSLFWFLVGIVLLFVGSYYNIFLMLFGLLMASFNIVGIVKSLFSSFSNEFVKKGVTMITVGVLFILFSVICNLNGAFTLFGIVFAIAGIFKALGLIESEDDDNNSSSKESDLWAVFDGDVMVSNPRYCSEAHKDWERLSKDPSFAGTGLTCKRVKKQG